MRDQWTISGRVRYTVRAVDIFLRSEDAYAALKDALENEPDWTNLLSTVPTELNERNVSAN
jgi:hypothetical protein